MGKRRPARRRTAASKKPKPGDSQAVNNAFVSALNHPTRRELLRIFLERDAPLSPKELAEHTGENLSTISYHVHVLADKFAIELVEEEPVRGSVAHFYRASALAKRTAWVRESLDLDLPKP
ncbi:MAG TPA: helix-turn-helix domain-containing protein [Solirubrobacterales bacterium]|nr:helix-turn-helix domain-containing protein [Solirubrobacterales bacterium]